jgi:hypothetical protein
MLISVCERDIETEQFDNFEDARNQMMKEFEKQFGDFEFENEDGDWLTWDNIKHRIEFDGGYDFYFGKYNAWSNIDDDCECDWKIVEIQ